MLSTIAKIQHIQVLFIMNPYKYLFEVPMSEDA